MVVKFITRKNEIRDALFELAKNGLPMTYESFGQKVSIWRMRGTKDLLDLIAEEEKAKKEPDITYMLSSATTKYPSQIGGRPAKPPTPEQKRLAREEMQMIINRHCPGAVNPY
ncbi:hypothetical protein [Rhizobium ruizarguesonis]|uniref:hypothetical protein n=1 Tax=Rhizobium ruizarguesonis TaxID=2081791 RepID=UPI0010316519|nr:hypothetical protein [Rhizobium ruizarguesonis]TBD22984.1 hypothetical protein ELH23_19885 [Rhizobium ruizarguesonis]